MVRRDREESGWATAAHALPFSVTIPVNPALRMPACLMVRLFCSVLDGSTSRESRTRAAAPGPPVGIFTGRVSGALSEVRLLADGAAPWEVPGMRSAVSVSGSAGEPVRPRETRRTEFKGWTVRLGSSLAMVRINDGCGPASRHQRSEIPLQAGQGFISPRSGAGDSPVVGGDGNTRGLLAGTGPCMPHCPLRRGDIVLMLETNSGA